MPFTARRPRSCLPRRAHSHGPLRRPRPSRGHGLTLAGNRVRWIKPYAPLRRRHFTAIPGKGRGLSPEIASLSRSDNLHR
eukprot:2799040-Prymnesium_polylepis.2